MKVLITGATGFVGTALRRALREAGFDVRAFVRTQSAHRIDASEGIEVVTGDVLESHACLRATTDVHAVVHLVGIRRENPRTGTTYEALHTEATYAVVDAARRNGVRRFVYLSGLGTRPDAPSRYHRTKWESEEIVRTSGMEWTIFRPSVIFGPGDEFHPLLVDLVHRPVVPIVDGGRSHLQPVSLRNLVSAMTASILMPEAHERVFEVGGPDRVTFVDLVRRVARHEGVWPNELAVPSRLMKPMVRILQRFRDFPLTLDELLMMLEDNVCDPEPFVRTFGITLDPYLEQLDELLGMCERRRSA